MDPDAPWQGSPEAAPGKAVEAEHDAALRSLSLTYRRHDGVGVRARLGLKCGVGDGTRVSQPGFRSFSASFLTATRSVSDAVLLSFGAMSQDELERFEQLPVRSETC